MWPYMRLTRAHEGRVHDSRLVALRRMPLWGLSREPVRLVSGASSVAHAMSCALSLTASREA